MTVPRWCFFCGSFLLFLFRVCHAFLSVSCSLVCSLRPCGHVLGKGWPLDFLCVMFSCVLSLSHIVFWFRFDICLHLSMIVSFFLTFLIYFNCIILLLLKDICGYFPCAPFLRLETGKVVWVMFFDHLWIRISTAFRYSDVISVCRHFLDKIK